MQPVYRYARVILRKSRRGRWSWHWQESLLGHSTTEQAFGYASREEAALAFCLTADGRGFSQLAQQVALKELGGCSNG